MRSTRFILAFVSFWGYMIMIVLILAFVPSPPSGVLEALVWASALVVGSYIAGRTIRPARLLRRKAEKDVVKFPIDVDIDK